MNTTDTPPPPPPNPNWDTRFELTALDSPCRPISILEALLKSPGRILYELKGANNLTISVILTGIAILCLGVYGLVVGSLSGGAQLYIAPAKILVGSILCILICLPSLYIFLCLGGLDVKLPQVAGELMAATALTGLLLISFAPVAWIFSQSTNSIGLMAFLNLLFWIIALYFGLRLLGKSQPSNSRGSGGNLKVWIMIYVVVCLQMMTTLRPIIGTAQTLLPEEKMFFLAHASDILFGTDR